MQIECTNGPRLIHEEEGGAGEQPEPHGYYEEEGGGGGCVCVCVFQGSFDIPADTGRGLHMFAIAASNASTLCVKSRLFMTRGRPRPAEECTGQLTP